MWGSDCASVDDFWWSNIRARIQYHLVRLLLRHEYRAYALGALGGSIGYCVICISSLNQRFANEDSARLRLDPVPSMMGWASHRKWWIPLRLDLGEAIPHGQKHVSNIVWLTLLFFQFTPYKNQPFYGITKVKYCRPITSVRLFVFLILTIPYTILSQNSVINIGTFIGRW